MYNPKNLNTECVRKMNDFLETHTNIWRLEVSFSIIYMQFHDIRDISHLCIGAITPTINSSSPGQNGRHVADDIFKRIFLNGKVRILITSSLKFVSSGSN